ncbi:MobF family relaxase [Streptomyces sp. NPDC002561]|uniref:MobF family relaxase n=1 Tax=Streptomyces sp. NPDC002561 TaxID=3154418 RepID=UPI00332C3344
MRNLFGERGRHPYADRIEADRIAQGDSPKQAFKAGALGRQVTVTGVDLVFRPQPSVYLLWALGDEETRRVIEAAHERAIERVLEWIEDEVAVIRYGKDGIYRVRPPGGLVAARFRHHEARSGRPLLHDHLLLSVKGQRLDGKWGSSHTLALHENTVAVSALYNELVMAEVCEELGLASEPREVTPGLRPVMEIAGVDQELIDWSSTRRRRIEDVLEGITDEYVKKHGRLPGERARHGLGWWAAQETRPDKKTPRPLDQLLAWWRVSALLKFGHRMVDGLLQRCQAAGAAIRARVGPWVDTALAAVDVAAVVFTVRGIFARRHVLAEARRHLLETLRGRAFTRGLDDYIADAALSRHSRQLTVPQKDRQAPAPDQLTHTADFAWPHRWWIAGTGGKPPRESSRYERARVASLALQNAIRDARISSTRDEAPTAAAPHAVAHPDRAAALTPAQRAAAIQAHQQAAMPEAYLGGRTTDAATWLRTPENLYRLAALTAQPTPAAAPSRTGRPRPPARPDRSTGPARSTSSTSCPAETKTKAASRDVP